LMGSSGITIYEPTTGDRADIGQITDFGAYYLTGGDPTPMLDWALACESEPKFFRDPGTDQPVDCLQYLYANAYDQAGREGSPWLCKGPPNPNNGNYSVFGGNWTVQQAHKPSLSALAFWATGDLGFLENLQYEANFMILTDSMGVATTNTRILHGEYRGVAWSLNLLFSAHTATADAEASLAAAGKPWPKWLKPSSYFKSLLDVQLAYFSTAMTNSGTATSVFHSVIPGYNVFAPWQSAYMLWSLAFGILTGHSDWGPLYLWALKNLIDMLSGTSGWPPAWIAYYIDASQPSWQAAFNALSDPNNAANRQEGFNPPTAAQVAALQTDPFNGGVGLGSPNYVPTWQAAIVAAQYLDSQGILAVRQTYPNLDTCAAALNKMVMNWGSMELRHSLVNDPTKAPSTIVPYAP